MKKTIIISGIFVLFLVFCKNQSKNTMEQENFVSEKYWDSVEVQSTNENLNEMELDTTKWVKFKSQYNFETFNAEVYTGKLADLDFTGSEFENDKDYVDFLMASNDTGINFGGHYTIIHKSCGCMCEHIFVIDRISGKIFNNINLTMTNDGDGKWGYLYKPDSKMLIANSNLFITDSLNCYTAVWKTMPELYLWTGKNFKRIQ